MVVRHVSPIAGRQAGPSPQREAVNVSGSVDLTLVGNLTDAPELRFTPAGVALASFSVASTTRILDKSSQTWVDGPTTFLRCTVWRESAEHAAASLSKGDRVVVMGALRQRSYETAEGDKRTVFEVDVSEVAASVRFAEVTVKRVSRATVSELPAAAEGKRAKVG